MKLFLDCEFTQLNQNTKLISLALVSEVDDEFYIELTDRLNQRHQEVYRLRVLHAMESDVINQSSLRPRAIQRLVKRRLACNRHSFSESHPAT